MNCVGCKKELERGEFVVFNGGAMVKTKTGATMGDKNLIGFLTVSAHFDSKNDYQSCIIANDAPNGQFELYACSYECLAEFLSRTIFNLKKLSEIGKNRERLSEIGKNRERLSEIGKNRERLGKIGKIREKLGKIEMAPNTKMVKIDPKWVNKVLKMLGHPEALVSDESLVGDFLFAFNKEYQKKQIVKLNKKFGFEVHAADPIWKLIEKFKKSQKNVKTN